jgi:hypothetical protein
MSLAYVRLLLRPLIAAVLVGLLASGSAAVAGYAPQVLEDGVPRDADRALLGGPQTSTLADTGCCAFPTTEAFIATGL